MLGLLVCVASLGMNQLSEPHDRLHAALADEYDALAGIVRGLETPEDAAEAKPELTAHAAEVNRLLADPRPFGRGRKAVSAALMRSHEGSLERRLERLRDAKSAAFERQGVGRVVSAALRDVPQSIHHLNQALD